MAKPWLYAISAAAGKIFEVRGKPIPVTLDSYEALVTNGRLTEDPWWYIRQNWRNAEVGDDVFVYTGDKNRGIVGYAKIADIRKRRGDWGLELRFDLRRCQALLRKPIPAGTVRRWVPFPRRNIISLVPFRAIPSTGCTRVCLGDKLDDLCVTLIARRFDSPPQDRAAPLR